MRTNTYISYQIFSQEIFMQKTVYLVLIIVCLEMFSDVEQSKPHTKMSNGDLFAGMNSSILTTQFIF
jgi:hypothetical protein